MRLAEKMMGMKMGWKRAVVWPESVAWRRKVPHVARMKEAGRALSIVSGRMGWISCCNEGGENEDEDPSEEGEGEPEERYKACGEEASVEDEEADVDEGACDEEG